MLSIIAKEKENGIAASVAGAPEITEAVAALLALKKVFQHCTGIDEKEAAEIMCKLLTDGRAENCTIEIEKP